MRACSQCGEKGETWILIAFMWPEELKRGVTKGVSLCSSHYMKFLRSLDEYNPEAV